MVPCDKLLGYDALVEELINDPYYVMNDGLMIRLFNSAFPPASMPEVMESMMHCIRRREVYSWALFLHATAKCKHREVFLASERFNETINLAINSMRDGERVFFGYPPWTYRDFVFLYFSELYSGVPEIVKWIQTDVNARPNRKRKRNNENLRDVVDYPKVKRRKMITNEIIYKSYLYLPYY